MIDKNQLVKDLAQFYGTKAYHAYGSYIMALLTDGTFYLAENAQSYWLFNLIDMQIYRNNWGLSIIFNTLEKDMESEYAVLKIDKDIGKPLYQSEPFLTNFPLDKIEIWSQYWSQSGSYIHMLKSEY